MHRILFCLFILTINRAYSQQDAGNKEPLESPMIEDNSFLLEEAYNQETGVVQFIQNCSFGSMSKSDWYYGFTNEIPLKGTKHQFSYTINYMNSNPNSGFADAMINYRCELTGKRNWVTTAPRLSILLPTGDESKGLGIGAWGGQFNFPASKVVTKFLVMHANAGYTYYHNINKTGVNDSSIVVQNNIRIINTGLSTVWVVRKRIHFICELIENAKNDFDEYGKRVNSFETIINPGLRFAFDLGKAQIVPGISFPVTLSGGKSTAGAFFYLSIEPDFTK